MTPVFPEMRNAPRQSMWAKIKQPEGAPPWDLTTILFALVVSFAAMIMGTFIAQFWFEGAQIANVAGWTFGALIMAGFVWQTRKHQREFLRLQPGGAPFPFILFICVGFAMFFDVIGLVFTGGAFLPAPPLVGIQLDGGAAVWFFVVLFMLVAQPAGEEVVFRGVAYPWLRHKLGLWGGVLICAGLYAGFHMLIYTPSYIGYGVSGSLPVFWYGLIVPFLDGVIISLIRAHSQSTRTAVIAHAGFGLFAVLKLLALSG
jgi:membrane protease YdiL (CAAX protease family)